MALLTNTDAEMLGMEICALKGKAKEVWNNASGPMSNSDAWTRAQLLNESAIPSPNLKQILYRWRAFSASTSGVEQGIPEAMIDWQGAGVTQQQIGAMLGNAMRLPVCEAVLAQLLYAAGLVSSMPVAERKNNIGWGDLTFHHTYNVALAMLHM